MAKAKSVNSQSSVLKKILENENHTMAEILKKSSYFQNPIMYKTEVPMVNIALSGLIEGGLSDGMTILAGPSRHFKSNFGLLMMKAFLDKDPENYVLFYDSEKGMTKGYFEAFGIDEDRVVHVPIFSVEDLKNKMSSILDSCERHEKIMFFVDSLGNLPSNKEVEDAKDQKIVVDMTRAKAVKSFTRVVSGQLKFKNIPAVIVAHTYKTQEMFSKDVIGGGTGVVYVPDNIWILGRRQNKDGDEIEGFDFVIRIEKSRFVREKSEIPIRVSFEHGIHQYSGLSDLAIEMGILESTKIKNSKVVTFTNKDGEETTLLEDDVDRDGKFWEMVFSETDFKQRLENKFRVSIKKMDFIEA